MPERSPPVFTSVSASSRDVTTMLKQCGLRLTRQRASLLAIMFSEGHQHVTANWLIHRANEEGIHVSLASIYNFLNTLKAAGLVRQVAAGNGRVVFDTNTAHHHHFYMEDSGAIIDIPEQLIVREMPPLPQGYTEVQVEILVSLRRKAR
jgi:Fur family iron response transcriptional regulator